MILRQIDSSLLFMCTGVDFSSDENGTRILVYVREGMREMILGVVGK